MLIDKRGERGARQASKREEEPTVACASCATQRREGEGSDLLQPPPLPRTFRHGCDVGDE